MSGIYRKRIFSVFSQFIKFGMVGLSNTVVHFGIYILVLRLMKRHEMFLSYDYIISSVTAFIVSVCWSFYWNFRYTFRDIFEQNVSVWKMLAKSFVCYSITGLFISNVLLYVWINKFNISKELAPAVNLFLTVPFNFIVHKCWVIRERKKVSKAG